MIEDLNVIGDCVEAVYSQIDENKVFPLEKIKRIVEAKTKPRDFEVLKNIAKGGYGEVFLAKISKGNNKGNSKGDSRGNNRLGESMNVVYTPTPTHTPNTNNTSKIYAMKRVPKDIVLKQPHTALFMAEKEVLIDSIGSQWLISAEMTLQDDQYLYYLMDFIPGGDFMGLLSKEDVLEEDWVRFYVVEIVSALDELHSLGWIHRDLKPDNILIGLDGHIKLADFGSCIKMKDGKARSSITVGTPDYVSPDILISHKSENEYTENLDFWTLGVIIYEMIYGTTPFYSSTLVETYRKINEINFIFPFKIGDNLKDLIQKLICKKEERLDIKGIKRHPFFEGVDWENVKKMIPPFIPELQSECDTSHFVDTNFESEDKSGNKKGEYLSFVGFTHDPKIVDVIKVMVDKCVNDRCNKEGTCKEDNKEGTCKEDSNGGTCTEGPNEDGSCTDGSNKEGSNKEEPNEDRCNKVGTCNENNQEEINARSLLNDLNNKIELKNKEIEEKTNTLKKIMMSVVDEKEELEEIQEEIKEKTNYLKKILIEINDRQVVELKDNGNEDTNGCCSKDDTKKEYGSRDNNYDRSVNHNFIPNKGIKFEDDNKALINDLQSFILPSLITIYEDCVDHLSDLQIESKSIFENFQGATQRFKSLEIENQKLKKVGVETLKKQVRILSTEIKEYEQKLNQEIHLRKQLEEELKSIKKDRTQNTPLKKYEFLCKVLEDEGSRYANEGKYSTSNIYKGSRSNSRYTPIINNNSLIPSIIKIIDDQFILNDTSYNLTNVFLHELKNNELHHQSYKNRSLFIKLIFIKESVKSVSSVGRRNIKSLEEDLKIEESMIQGLETMMSLLNGKQLEEASKQLVGSQKKMAQIKSEINMARKSTLTEEVPEDPIKLYEFNNHLFATKTFPPGTLCEHCNEVLYGIKDQGFECRDCRMVVHKSCYVLGDVSCEMYNAFKTGETYYVMMRSIEEKEKLIGVYKKF